MTGVQRGVHPDVRSEIVHAAWDDPCIQQSLTPRTLRRAAPQALLSLTKEICSRAQALLQQVGAFGQGGRTAGALLLRWLPGRAVCKRTYGVSQGDASESCQVG